MTGGQRFTWFMVVPLVSIIVAVIVLVATGHPSAATVVSDGGTLAVLAANVVYIVFWDSKKRRRGVNARTRMARMMTFYRG